MVGRPRSRAWPNTKVADEMITPQAMMMKPARSEVAMSVGISAPTTQASWKMDSKRAKSRLRSMSRV
jgi:hypothetical protein